MRQIRGLLAVVLILCSIAIVWRSSAITLNTNSAVLVSAARYLNTSSWQEKSAVEEEHDVGGPLPDRNEPSDEAMNGGSARILPHASSGASQFTTLSSSNEDVAHIALISHGWRAGGYENNDTIKGRKRSVELVLRGLAKTTRSCPLHLHFITGPPDEARIRPFLQYWNSSMVPVEYSFHDLNETQLAEWMSQIRHTPTHRTGAAGNVKFFYPLTFPHLDRLIMLDSDVLIGRDICDLWALFKAFKPQQLFGFVPQWPGKPVDPVKDNVFNAGVALLHLERMRNRNWIRVASDSITNWEKKGMKPKCCAHGDQSVFHMIRYLYPETIGYLPRWWNINKCHNYQNIHKNPKGSFVGIVHLGCCKMCTLEKIGPRWATMVRELEAYDLTANGQHRPHEVQV